MEKTFTIPNDIESLSIVREEVREFLGPDCDSLVKSRIVFCLDEVLSNVIEHGFPDQKKANIEIKMINQDTQWSFIVTDDGIPFDPTKKKSETWKELYESGAEGGFGLRALKKIVTLHYDRLGTPTKNQLTLSHKKDFV